MQIVDFMITHLGVKMDANLSKLSFASLWDIHIHIHVAVNLLCTTVHVMIRYKVFQPDSRAGVLDLHVGLAHIGHL